MEQSNYERAPIGSNGAAPALDSPDLGNGDRETSTLGAAGTSIAELEELASRNPNDVVAHLVLANVYIRNGNPEAALHVYRRVAKKRGLSPFIVGLLYEDLNFLESEIKLHPRLNLVRGDLLIGEGRYREAMDEYNKMAQLAARR